MQLQAAWNLTSFLSVVNYNSGRFVPCCKGSGHCGIDYFSVGPKVDLSKLKEHTIYPCNKSSDLLTMDVETLNN